MCLLPVTDHPTHRRTDKPSYRDAWTLDTSKNEWRWGYFINIKQKTEDNTETLFTAKILALTSIFEGFYARYRATSIKRGWIWSDMHGQIMLQMACTDVALNYCMKNMIDVPIIPNVLKMLIQGPVAPVSRMGTPCVVYRHPTSFWCPYLAFSPSNWSMRQLRHVANSKTTFWQLRHLRLSFAFWLILSWSKWMPKAG